MCRKIILINKSGTKFEVCARQAERFEWTVSQKDVYFFQRTKFSEELTIQNTLPVTVDSKL